MLRESPMGKGVGARQGAEGEGRGKGDAGGALGGPNDPGPAIVLARAHAWSWTWGAVAGPSDPGRRLLLQPPSPRQPAPPGHGGGEPWPAGADLESGKGVRYHACFPPDVPIRAKIQLHPGHVRGRRQAQGRKGPRQGYDFSWATHAGAAGGLQAHPGPPGGREPPRPARLHAQRRLPGGAPEGSRLPFPPVRGHPLGRRGGHDGGGRRGAEHHPQDPAQPRRGGGGPHPLLRGIRLLRRELRRHGAPGAHQARFHPGPGRPRRGPGREDRGGPDQLTQQPDRHGLFPRGADRAGQAARRGRPPPGPAHLPDQRRALPPGDLRRGGGALALRPYADSLVATSIPRT